MNLSKKRKLAMRTFGVGSDRIVFVESRKDEIKEAITKQDIRDLYENGAIIIKERKGRKTVVRKKNRSVGNIRKIVNKRKSDYITLTRKLRNYLRNPSVGLSKESLLHLRNKIRNREFKNKAQLKEYLMEIKK